MKKIIVFLVLVLSLLLWSSLTFAQSNSIYSIVAQGTTCNGGGRIVVTTSLDGESNRYLTVTANTTIMRDVSNRSPGGHVDDFYFPALDLSAPSYAIRVVVRLGSSPWGNDFGQHTYYFHCEDGRILTPAVDARIDRYTIPRNVPTELFVSSNDVSVLPLHNVRIMTQPQHGVVVHGEGNRLIVTADADYIGTDSFQYRICDISNLCDTGTVRLTIVNLPPTCDAAADNSTWYWAPNHEMVQVQVNGVVDPDGDPFTLIITAITVHDVLGGSGSTADDYDLENGLIRVERSGRGDGRTYELAFEATDIWGDSCSGIASVYVPHDRNDIPDETSSESASTTDTQSHGNANGNGNGNANGNANGHSGNGGNNANASGGGGQGNPNNGNNGNDAENGNANGNSNGNGNANGRNE